MGQQLTNVIIIHHYSPSHWSQLSAPPLATGHRIMNSTECPKKMLFSGKTAITAFKLIQNANAEFTAHIMHSFDDPLHFHDLQ